MEAVGGSLYGHLLGRTLPLGELCEGRRRTPTGAYMKCPKARRGEVP